MIYFILGGGEGHICIVTNCFFGILSPFVLIFANSVAMVLVSLVIYVYCLVFLFLRWKNLLCHFTIDGARIGSDK